MCVHVPMGLKSVYLCICMQIQTQKPKLMEVRSLNAIKKLHPVVEYCDAVLKYL